MHVTMIGIDLAKSVFQVCGTNQAGRPVFNKPIKRANLRHELRQYPNAVIAMEACSGSNYWGRELQAMGFKVMLIPPQHVKPFVKGNKNDRNDAFAITEAARRPGLRCVEPRTLAQTDLIQTHRVLERLIRERTKLVNQLRGFLGEYGVVVPPGRRVLKGTLPLILEDAENGLTASARELFYQQYTQWQHLDESIDAFEKQIARQAKSHTDTRRLMTIKGIAERTSTAIVAHAGRGEAYKNGRHFAASLGLVPSEHSSGGKQMLGRITKRGNRYLRFLLVQCAWSILRTAKGNTDRLSCWAQQILARRGKHKAVVAVAHKLARIAWSVLYHNRDYETRPCC